MLTWLIIFTLVIGISAYFRLALVVWSIILGATLFLFSFSSVSSASLLLILWVLYLLVIVPLNLRDFRKYKLSLPVKELMSKALPPISQTEQEALDAGSVWWEGELFSGMPDYSKLRDLPAPKLTEEEQEFIDGPVNALCEMIDDWDITQNQSDLPDEIWQYIKDNKFMAMIIPKKYGGLEFSAYANAMIVTKLASRSATASSTIGVPNSLGPAELLLHYGTEEQKDRYLPGLASGAEIPCFALTSPQAGSDAAALIDNGVVCKGTWEGEEIIGIRLNWEKRYITL
ncbi:MAG: acyl-CoA dehydrogenase family protein, partial [Gammaproteobacteria bacterium]|nr:acyl-CoA dehydrogenase family protein [Gammaproteobacteria bacterium]